VTKPASKNVAVGYASHSCYRLAGYSYYYSAPKAVIPEGQYASAHGTHAIFELAYLSLRVMWEDSTCRSQPRE
jgi:hypothetical protein